MTIGQAQDINLLLNHIYAINTTPPPFAKVQAAAERLAAKAHDKLGAGVRPGDLGRIR